MYLSTLLKAAFVTKINVINNHQRFRESFFPSEVPSPRFFNGVVASGYPQQIIANAHVSAFIRYLRAEICQHVTWEQRLQPYSANWLKPPLQTDPQQQITIEALVGTFLRDFGTMFATALPKLPEVTVANRFTTKIIIKAPVVASIRDFKAKIFKQVTWGQCLHCMAQTA